MVDTYLAGVFRRNRNLDKGMQEGRPYGEGMGRPFSHAKERPQRNQLFPYVYLRLPDTGLRESPPLLFSMLYGRPSTQI